MSDRQDIIPLVLAGGRGTRLAGVRADIPKPAMPVAGRPFLSWILEQLSAAGFDRAIVSSGHLAHELEREVTPFVPSGMKISWIAEPRPLGTAGGLVFAAKRSGMTPARWLVLNGDSYLEGDWAAAVCSAREGALVARRLSDVSRYGALRVESGRVRGFAEKGRTGSGLVNAGIYAWPAEWIDEITDDAAISLESNIIPRWLATGRRIDAIEQDGAFIDIGTPESLATATEFMRRLHVGTSS